MPLVFNRGKNQNETELTGWGKRRHQERLQLDLVLKDE